MYTLSTLFDVNGSFGRTSTGNLEFPSIQSRIDHMDRLGIARSLVWNVESRENNATASNQRLLAEIDQTPGAEERIVPSLSISGLMNYEKNAISTLKNQMKERGTRSLRFVSFRKGTMTLCQLEPVIREIRKLKPFIVMRHDETSVEDILDFTDMFPEIPFILTEVIWGDCIKVFDLMRRRDNIMIDNSWLHSDGATELVIRHFGAKRIVFGTGYKSHNGAAIAALACSESSKSDQERIAFRNLEKMTEIKFSGKDKNRFQKSDDENCIWRRFLAGQNLGVELIDAHGHFGPSGGYVLENQNEKSQIKRALKVMKKPGASLMISSGMQALMGDPVIGNEILGKALAKHTDRLKGYLGFNPFYADELTATFDKHFSGSVYVGFKTLCSYWHVALDDPRFKPMWSYANKHKLPILSHTWGKNDILALENVVGKYPDAQFLIAHSGGPDAGRVPAEELAIGNSNVYLEWCGSFCSTICWEETLRKVDPRQVVFGTDAMMHDFNWELGRLLSLDIPEETLVPILGENMRRILEMRCD